MVIVSGSFVHQQKGEIVIEIGDGSRCDGNPIDVLGVFWGEIGVIELFD